MPEKITRVPLREVWPREDSNFTPWLVDNLDELSIILPFDIAAGEREQAAGTSWVDIVAQSDTGETVVIENQLETSDHDHLGKAITYLSAYEAKAVVWIVKDARPEHLQAITWLNESTPVDFFLVKVEAIRIGGSPPAALLTLLTGPSEELKRAGQTKAELAEDQRDFERFWTELLAKANRVTQLHSRCSPGKANWLGAGWQGKTFNYVVTQNTARVELYIDKGDQSENKRVFDAMLGHRARIEASFGRPLEWIRRDDRRASKIVAPVRVGQFSDESTWATLQDSLIETMVAFEAALRPILDELGES